MEISILLDGANSCNMNCSYCLPCNHTPKKGDVKINKEELLIRVKEQLARFPNTTEWIIFFWGGEPLLYRDAIEQLIPVLSSTVPGCSFQLSTNGLLLKDKNVRDWLRQYKIKLQLSYDGLGQHLRSSAFSLDKENDIQQGIVELFKDRTITMVNCTHNRRNSSPIANLGHFNNFFKTYDIDTSALYIKFNHITPTEIDKANLLFDWKSALCYYQELLQILILDKHTKSKELKPYMAYIRGELVDKFCGPTQNKNAQIGGCLQYATGQSDHNFVITTSGEYAPCNLTKIIEVRASTLAPPTIDYCNGCAYRKYYTSDCMGCPQASAPKECIQNYIGWKTREIAYILMNEPTRDTSRTTKGKTMHSI